MEATIIYYTSNREKPEFEEKIKANLLKACGDLPIISVSQKPIDLGKNICVGDVGLSYINEYRQILIGLKEVKTEYFISCESDFLYPKDYFEFKPSGENIYRSDNVWVVKELYNKKSYSEGAQIAKTNYMIKFIEHYLDGLPMWFNGKPNKNKIYRQHQKELWRLPFTFIHTNPCITFKTSNSVNKKTKVEDYQVNTLPIWDNINKLKNEYELN